MSRLTTEVEAGVIDTSSTHQKQYIPFIKRSPFTNGSINGTLKPIEPYLV